AAAAGDDQQIRSRHRAARDQGIEAADRGGYFRAAAVALDADRPDHHTGRETVSQAMQDVPDDRPGGRGNDTDDPGQEWQEPLAAGIEQAFGREPLAPLLEQGHESADAGGLHGLDDDLVLGLAREGGELAGDDDLQALLGLDL